jgi:threonine/homoserine/homoserine lactone efflux protein
MLKYLLLGGGYAFAAAIQPGPLQAFLVSRVAAIGARRTLPASFAPLVSDGPIAVLAILALGQLSRGAQSALQAAGGCLLVYLGWVAFRQWRAGTETAPGVSAPRTFFEAVLVNLLNPNPYLGWALVLGPAVHAAWQEEHGYAVLLVAAFYTTMAVTLAAFILLVGTTRFLGTRAQRAMVGVSAAVLAGLGVFLLTDAAWRFAKP